MKRRYFVAIALFALIALCGANANAASVGTWLTYREDISIASGTCDIDVTFWRNGTGTAADVYLNLSLPCTVGDLTNTSATCFSINVSAEGTNGTYNLSVNGNSCNASSFTNQSVFNITTLPHIIAAGVLETARYLNFTWNCTTADTSIAINLTGASSAFNGTWLTAVQVIKEKDVSKLPYVGTSSTNSVHTVNDSFNISSTSLWFPITNCVWNITYPSHKITGTTTNFTDTTVAANGTIQHYLQYQKYGPYVYDVDEDIDGITHTVIIKLKANEILTNCVQWNLDPDDEVYDEAFDDLNDGTLDIEYNGVDFSDWEWDEDDEELVLEDFTVRDGISNNKFTFTWTEAVAPPTEPVETMWDWFFNDICGIPYWAVITVIIIAAVIIGYIYWPKPKKRKK